MKKRTKPYPKDKDQKPIICGPDPVEYKSLPAEKKAKKSSQKYLENPLDISPQQPEGFLIQ
jgi:hypothetical protein